MMATPVEQAHFDKLVLRLIDDLHEYYYMTRGTREDDIKLSPEAIRHLTDVSNVVDILENHPAVNPLLRMLCCFHPGPNARPS